MSAAMREDLPLCHRVIAMRRYSNLRSAEIADGKLTDAQKRWMRMVEDAAGLIAD